MASTHQYQTQGGIQVSRTVVQTLGAESVEALAEQLNTRRGVLLSSNYDYPGRYTRWDLGTVNPPLEFATRDRQFWVRALNQRGSVLIQPIFEQLQRLQAVEALAVQQSEPLAEIRGSVCKPTRRVSEEQRSRQPSVFSVLRGIVDLFRSSEDEHLGLYGAFGYDLTFQFEAVQLARPRPADQRDLVLYLPDELLVVDHQRQTAERVLYEFTTPRGTTAGLPRTGQPSSYVADLHAQASCDHAPGEYAASVETAKKAFKRGDLFEVVLSQTFIEPYHEAPAAIFRRLRERNPAPYALFLNLGESEFLVGASPEMYVRVEDKRVETCPISGTIARGRDAVEDAARIKELLDSHKDESELTMCTDVDRNDKSRICEPGSVRVIGRRQIELYSRLIHTVDHVEGRLLDGFDALDAFLSHTWAVTVTGAPKAWAIQHVENAEKSVRAWYGGAIGVVGFSGSLNTGLTLRTVRLKQGRAEVRVGATLLFDSEPEAEERETRIKASAFLDAVRGQPVPVRANQEHLLDAPRRVLLVDHQDSFVHTLGNYLRQTGAQVTTLRPDLALQQLDELQPDLVFLSPGPGSPRDFKLQRTIESALARQLPVFGVCLGLQGIVEYFGGTLGVLDYPMHGKPSAIEVLGGQVLGHLPRRFSAGRYHSLYAEREHLPACLEVTAQTSDGVIMAIEHRSLPVAGVQFHPESILTMEGDVGLKLLRDAIAHLTRSASKAQ